MSNLSQGLDRLVFKRRRKNHIKLNGKVLLLFELPGQCSALSSLLGVRK